MYEKVKGASRSYQNLPGWVQVFMLILSEPLMAKMSFWVNTTHLAHFYPHTSLCSYWLVQRQEAMSSFCQEGWMRNCLNWLCPSLWCSRWVSESIQHIWLIFTHTWVSALIGGRRGVYTELLMVKMSLWVSESGQHSFTHTHTSLCSDWWA